MFSPHANPSTGSCAGESTTLPAFSDLVQDRPGSRSRFEAQMVRRGISFNQEKDAFYGAIAAFHQHLRCQGYDPDALLLDYALFRHQSARPECSRWACAIRTLRLSFHGVFVDPILGLWIDGPKSWKYFNELSRAREAIAAWMIANRIHTWDALLPLLTDRAALAADIHAAFPGAAEKNLKVLLNRLWENRCGETGGR